MFIKGCFRAGKNRLFLQKLSILMAQIEKLLYFPYGVTEWTQDKQDYLSHMCNKSWKWQIERRWPETRPQIKANLVACLRDVQICHCLLTK